MKTKLLFLITASALLCFPKENFGQSTNLGRGSTFSLFTANGAFNNLGPTNITGDIGTNVGAFTGFPPGIVTGQIHVADSVSAIVATDVNTAFTNIGLYTCDSTIGVGLGNGQVLTAKVYCLGAASTLNGTLTLNGQGNAGAIFIFKITGALSTGIKANIVLTNLASLSNVYFRVDGAFTLSDSSVFRGNVIANGAISLLQGSSLLGRGLTRTGLISTNSNTNSLPVKLLSFNAKYMNQNVVLNWISTSEINNDFYSVERGTDGVNWNVIAHINGAGNSSKQNNYSFTDNQPTAGVSYYRLKQTDFDGKSEYFNVAAVNNYQADQTELDVYPNPANGTVNLIFNGAKEDVISVSIYNVLGTKVYSSESYQTAIDLSDKQNGIYFLQFNLNSKSIIKKLVIEN